MLKALLPERGPHCECTRADALIAGRPEACSLFREKMSKEERRRSLARFALGCGSVEGPNDAISGIDTSMGVANVRADDVGSGVYLTGYLMIDDFLN